MTASSCISLQQQPASHGIEIDALKSLGVRLFGQNPKSPDNRSCQITDVCHRTNVEPSAAETVAGAFSAEGDNIHRNTSLQASGQYQQSSEGAWMKNRNKLQPCLQIRDEIVTALRRDLMRFRSAARTLAEICGKSERTAANWLSGSTGMNAEDLLRASEALPTLREMVLSRLSPPDDYSLAQELTMLRARLARAETRYREEFNVESRAPDRLDFPMDASAASEAFGMAPASVRSLGATTYSNPAKAGI